MTLALRHDIRSSSHLGVTDLLSHQSSVLSPLLSLWRKIVALHHEVEATKWGSLVLGNVWPAYLFALPLGARVWNLLRARYRDSLHEQASLLQEIVTIVFLALVVVLFAIRRRGIEGQRATLQSGGVALLGTFLLNVVGYLPIQQN